MLLQMRPRAKWREIVHIVARGLRASGTCMAEERLPRIIPISHLSMSVWAIGGLYTRR
jgi:hypothetical protein